MNFENLIDRYSVEYEIVTKPKGQYINGVYVTDTEQSQSIFKKGAIVAIPRKKIYQSGGYLTEKDLELFSYEPLTGEEVKVRYKNSLYSVEEDRDYSRFAGVYVYVLKWVNNFDEPKPNNR